MYQPQIKKTKKTEYVCWLGYRHSAYTITVIGSLVSSMLYKRPVGSVAMFEQRKKNRNSMFVRCSYYALSKVRRCLVESN